MDRHPLSLRLHQHRPKWPVFVLVGLARHNSQTFVAIVLYPAALEISTMSQTLTVEPGKQVRLADFDPGYHGKLEKQVANDESARLVAAITPLAERLYAENKRSVLLVLQGMDTSGKDGTIRHVLSGVNPQSCQVTSFKAPTPHELDHDFLWRIHANVPARGNIGIFNRSHYEDVLIARVHQLVPKKVWSGRYDLINAFEQLLVSEGTTIIKVFLHIGKDEQRERLQARIDDPEKRWKFNLADLSERKVWDKYLQAYEDAISRCNTAAAPWHIVPANRKWYRNLIVSRLLHDALVKLDPQFPPSAADLKGVVVE